jgi:hypothetical protein
VKEGEGGKSAVVDFSLRGKMANEMPSLYVMHRQELCSVACLTYCSSFQCNKL